MNEARALVILFNGDEPNRAALANVGAALNESCSAENLNCFAFSAQDLATILLKAGPITIASMQDEEMTPEDKAVIYIGVLLEKDLKEPFDGYKFFRAVLNKIDEVKIHFSEEEHKRLMNALFILSQEDLEVSKKLLKKYHFSQEKILILKKVYNFVTTL